MCNTTCNKLTTFLFHFQENTSTISLHSSNTRTTSGLECYNSHLSRKLKKRGNFFKFLERLQLDEVDKLRSLSQLIDGSRYTFEPQNKKFKKRKELISTITSDRQANRITIAQFLNQITHSHVNDENIQINFSNDDFEEDVGPTIENVLEDLPRDEIQKEPALEELNYNKCIECVDIPKEIVLIPCGPLLLCLQCYMKIGESNSALNLRILCPICEKVVTNSQKIIL